jgi:hypothetical protein
MAYILFHKKENSNGALYKIAENDLDLNSLNIIKSDYKIITTDQENFLNIKFGIKETETYNDNDIIYKNLSISFLNKDILKNHINIFLQQIDQFLKCNPNHFLFAKWNDYKSTLNSLNLDTITYPLEKSLEKHLDDLGQPALSPLQLP